MAPSTASPWSAVRWAVHDGVRLAHDRFAERPDGEPLLLVAGLGAGRQWVPDGLCSLLAAQGFAVARYDQRDGGASTRLPPAGSRSPVSALLRRRRQAPYTAEDMADDAVAVLDALGWPSAHLLGVSLGGAVAQRVTLRHPDRVRTLTSMAAVPGDVGGLPTLRYVRLGTLARFARLRFPDTREGHVAAGEAVARLLAAPSRPFDTRAARETAERHADGGLHDREAQGRQLGARWHGPPISAIDRPTLVLHGAEDPLIRPSAATAIASRVRGARTVLLPGVGHELPEHAWETVATAVRDLADAADFRAAAGPAA